MVDIALECACQLGEGPIWDHRSRRLLFVDIDGHAIHSFDPASGAHRVVPAGGYVSAVALAAAGGYVVTLQHDVAWFDGERFGERPLRVEADRDDTRFNDGYVDPRGRFWAGTMSLVGKPAQGALYRIDMNPAPRVTRVLEGVTTSNGIDWSLDERLMYYADTGTRRIDVFDFDPETAALANRRPFATFAEAEGKPDGLVLDEEGCVWVALWQGSAVRRYGPDGRLLRQIDLPVSRPTKCAFGGANLDALYITSAKSGEAHAGSVFVTRPGVRGRRARVFSADSAGAD